VDYAMAYKTISYPATEMSLVALLSSHEMKNQLCQLVEKVVLWIVASDSYMLCINRKKWSTIISSPLFS